MGVTDGDGEAEGFREASSHRVMTRDVANDGHDRRRRHGTGSVALFAEGTRFRVDVRGPVRDGDRTDLVEVEVRWGRVRLDCLVRHAPPAEGASVDGLLGEVAEALGREGRGDLVRRLIGSSREEAPDGYAESRAPLGEDFDLAVLEALHADQATRPALLAAMAAVRGRDGRR